MTQAASLPMGVPQFRPIPKIVPPKPEYAEIESNPSSISFNNQVLEPSGFKPLSIERSGIEAVVRDSQNICILINEQYFALLEQFNVKERISSNFSSSANIYFTYIYRFYCRN